MHLWSRRAPRRSACSLICTARRSPSPLSRVLVGGCSSRRGTARQIAAAAVACACRRARRAAHSARRRRAPPGWRRRGRRGPALEQSRRLSVPGPGDRARASTRHESALDQARPRSSRWRPLPTGAEQRAPDRIRAGRSRLAERWPRPGESRCSDGASSDDAGRRPVSRDSSSGEPLACSPSMGCRPRRLASVGRSVVSPVRSSCLASLLADIRRSAAYRSRSATPQLNGKVERVAELDSSQLRMRRSAGSDRSCEPLAPAEPPSVSGPATTPNADDTARCGRSATEVSRVHGPARSELSPPVSPSASPV